MKKFICSLRSLLSLTIIMAVLTAPIHVFAAEEQLSDMIKGKAAVLVEKSTGQVLYEYNAHEKLSIASVTKVMSLLLIAEDIEKGNMKLTDIVKCSETAAGMGGSQIWLEPGEEMTVEELLKAVVISSANDACVLLAEKVAGSETSFVQKMNSKAKELGMSNTQYVNAVGFDADGHYSSAYDISIVSRELMNYDVITQYMLIWMDSLRNGETSLVNTNKLIRSYDGILGIKTGYETDAGFCLSACARRNGMEIISVVLGSATGDDRFQSSRKLLDYGFAGFELFTPQIDSALLKPVPVSGGVDKKVPVTVDFIKSCVIEKGRGADVTYEYDITDKVTAQVEKGQTLGTVRVLLNGKEILSSSIVAANGVDKMTFGRGFKILLENMFKL